MSDARPVLNQLNLVARDFDATVAFYRHLGFEIPVHPPDAFGGLRHAEVEFANDFTLEFDNLTLAETYNAAWRRGGSSRALIGFSLASRDAVDALYARLTSAGYEGRQRPYDAFWGARYAVIADPDGNDVGLMSPIDDARRSNPPRPSPG
jgi:uncharacterized glyoxalase superfamily protein PhnB